MKLIGIQNFKGIKNDKNYDFTVVYFVDNRPFDGLRGSRAMSATLTSDVSISGLEIGKEYTILTYRGYNGRLYCNGII